MSSHTFEFLRKLFVGIFVLISEMAWGIGAYQRLDNNTISDRCFFEECVNLEYPGLETVKMAVKCNNYQRAKVEYVKYLRTKKSSVWMHYVGNYNNFSGSNKNYNIAAADRIANNLLESCNIPHQYDRKIDWSLNPTNPYYVEWTWQLNRHWCWVVLGQAYSITGNEKYAKAFVNQINDWIIDNPMPETDDEAPSSRWRTLETGIRMANTWPEAFFRFLGSSSLDNETIILILKSFHDHGYYLSLFNTTVVAGWSGLYHVAVLFPEFKESMQWENQAVQRICAELKNQIDLDGSQITQAPSYHGVAVDNIRCILQLAMRNGKKLPNEYLRGLESMYEYYEKLRLPDGHLPGLNDSDWYHDAINKIKQGYTDFPERKDFLYVATYGKEGVKPSFTSVWMPWSGWYVMRSDWSKEALYAHFEVGPYAWDHSHEDKLSFTLEGYGNMLLTECGNYPYDGSEWRKYALSARAHNVTRVDGKDQNRFSLRDRKEIQRTLAPLQNRWKSTINFDFGEGWYNEGFGPKNDSVVTHYRALIFIKDKCWILFDVFTPSDNELHRYESFFHFDAPKATINNVTKGVESLNSGKAVLSIIPFINSGMDVSVITGQRNPEVQGWVHVTTKGTNTYECRSVATPIFKREVKGQWIEPYLLLPLKAGSNLSVSSVEKKSAGKYLLHFNDGSSLEVIYKVENNRLSYFKYVLKDKTEGKNISAKLF